jgi:copper chaperone CopZ
MYQSVTLAVNGMKCAGCEANASKALNALAGVASAQASSKDKAITVAFDDSVCDLAAIKVAIAQAGYHVEDPA